MILLDSNGLPIRKPAEENCPKCGKTAKDRVPSGGFGKPHWVCLCGFEFNGELLCPSIESQNIQK